MKLIENSNERLSEIEGRYKTYDFPPSVLVEATAFCNLRCIQCANSTLKRKKGYIDINLYKKVVDEVAEENPDTNFWLAFYGEPLLLKYKLYYMIKYAKEKGLTDTYLNTNGMLLDAEMADLLIEAGIDHVVVGIDGYSTEVFEKIRVGAKRDIVYNNIINFSNKIEKLRRGGVNGLPVIEIQFIEMDENEHEIEEYKNFWKEQGLRVKIRSRVSWSNHVQKGVNLKQDLNRIACGWAIGTCPITWDGNMVACGTDCDAECVFGNVMEQSIKEIWNGKRQDFVSYHMNHEFSKLPKLCLQCQDWQVIGTINLDEQGNEYNKEYK